MKQPRQWFRIENKAETPTVADIQIQDLIGSWDDDWFARNFGLDMGVTARAFVEQLAALPDTVTTIRVHINSPGGDVQGGINIANALRAQLAKGRTVETIIDGLAASIASVIAMAGTTVTMADNALMMVHNPFGGVIGDARELRKFADILDAMRGQIIATYQWHSSMSVGDLEAFMDAETWMNADEAIAAGFATAKVEGLQAAAAIDPRGLAGLKVPDRYRAQVEAFLCKQSAPPLPAESQSSAAVDVVRACREADCLELAETLVAAGLTLDQVQARLTEAKAAKAAAAARATEIRGLCLTAKLPELADGYIAGAMALSDVRAQLTVITAKLDAIEIDGHLSAGQRSTDGTKPWAQIFDKRH